MSNKTQVNKQFIHSFIHSFVNQHGLDPISTLYLGASNLADWKIAHKGLRLKTLCQGGLHCSQRLSRKASNTATVINCHCMIENGSLGHIFIRGSEGIYQNDFFGYIVQIYHGIFDF